MREVTPQGEVRYEYDAANRRTAMELGNGARWEYGYDPAGRLLSVSHPQGAVSYAYDAAGRMTTVNLPHQVIASYSYDAANQITGITYSRAGVEIGDLSYSYDDAGRRISQGGSLARLGESGPDFDATYDAANRLITFNGQPLSYDPNGNLLSGLGQSYVWNARDQLSQTADLSFSYDALGRRTQRTDATATTGYLHDGANPIQVDQTLMLSGLGLDAFAAEITPSGTQTYIRDALGSVLAMVDDTGATTGENRYSAYGQTTTTGEASQFAYTGREEDADDLYFYRARYYSPVLSRFLSEDPIGLQGGSNVYGYVSGDPLRFTDPLGLEPGLFGLTANDVRAMSPLASLPPDVAAEARNAYFNSQPVEFEKAKVQFVDYSKCVLKCEGRVIIEEGGTRLLEKTLSDAAQCVATHGDTPGARKVAKFFGKKAIPLVGQLSTVYSGVQALGCFYVCQ
nr:hypothetical protein [Oceanococcus sp. HetDA_MAG_MS8]